MFRYIDVQSVVSYRAWATTNRLSHFFRAWLEMCMSQCECVHVHVYKRNMMQEKASSIKSVHKRNVHHYATYFIAWFYLYRRRISFILASVNMKSYQFMVAINTTRCVQTRNKRQTAKKRRKNWAILCLNCLFLARLVPPPFSSAVIWAKNDP